jgi:hypothetical protein
LAVRSRAWAASTCLLGLEHVGVAVGELGLGLLEATLGTGELALDLGDLGVGGDLGRRALAAHRRRRRHRRVGVLDAGLQAGAVALEHRQHRRAGAGDAGRLTILHRADRGAFAVAGRGLGDELGVGDQELVELALAGAQLVERLAAQLGRELGRGLGRLDAHRRGLVAEQRRQPLGHRLGAIRIGVLVVDDEGVGAARPERDLRAQLLDRLVLAVLGQHVGERVHRRVAHHLDQRAARQQQLAVALADVAVHRRHVAVLQEAGLQPLLVVEHRARLVDLGPGHREHHRQHAADQEQAGGQPPVAAGAVPEAEQLLEPVARGGRGHSHRR